MVDRTNHIWRTSNLHCKSSMAWLIAQSNLVSPMYCNNHLKEICYFPLLVLTLFYDTCEKYHFCLLFIVHGSPHRFLTMVRFTPIICVTFKGQLKWKEWFLIGFKVTWIGSDAICPPSYWSIQYHKHPFLLNLPTL